MVLEDFDDAREVTRESKQRRAATAHSPNCAEDDSEAYLAMQVARAQVKVLDVFVRHVVDGLRSSP